MKRFFLLIFSVVALGGAGYAVREAVHSSLFLVRVVEVSDLPENAPVDAQAITELAAVPVGPKDRVTLFTLDLDAVEKRVLSNSWIREVHLQKRFPQTISISVVFRQPRAFLQTTGGALSYVDIDGTSFGRANLAMDSDLPFISVTDPAKASAAIKLFSDWEKSPFASTAKISTVSYEGERGFRMLLVYPLLNRSVARTSVDFGQLGADGPQFENLSQVLKYLSVNSIAARQVYADAGKKIVVKTAHGS